MSTKTPSPPRLETEVDSQRENPMSELPKDAPGFVHLSQENAPDEIADHQPEKIVDGEVGRGHKIKDEEKEVSLADLGKITAANTNRAQYPGEHSTEAIDANIPSDIALDETSLAAQNEYAAPPDMLNGPSEGLPGGFDRMAQLQPELPPTLPVTQFDEQEFAVDPPGSEALNREQTGYFKLELPDAQLYIDTLRTIIGRDVDAVRRKKLGTLQHDGSQYDGMSIVSESGGVVNLGLKESRRHGHSRSRTSRSSSEYKGSRRNSLVQHELPSKVVTNRKNGTSKRPSARIHSKITSAGSRGDDDTTVVRLHAKEGSHGGGISRDHAAIVYNFEEQAFELQIYGRNGAFVNDQFYHQTGVVNLVHGCTITISGVSMRWLLPNDGQGVLGSEAQSAMSFEFEDGRGESIAMHDSSDSTSSDEEDDGEVPELETNDVDLQYESDDDEPDSDEGDAALIHHNIDHDEDESDNADDHEVELAESRRVGKAHRSNRPVGSKPKPSIKLSFKKAKPTKETKAKKNEAELALDKSSKSKSKPPSTQVEPKPEPVPDPAMAEFLKSIPPEMIPPKRKGPGRPPKNGIMSKREQALLVRQQKEAQKAEAIKNGTLKATKLKPGEVDDALTGKRKYTKRRRPEDEQEGSAEFQDTIEGGDDGQELSPSAGKPFKEKRPPKPARSPSPVFDESQLTPEQLAKPTQSYVILIHEALSNAPSGHMSLPQIYRAIERRYPYFKLKVSTQGWQSSVRHNLSQHAAFKKIEREGKGWQWGLVPDINIEKEKKRRPTPPPMPPQPYYQPPPQMFRPQQFAYPGMPPDGRQPPPHMPYMYPPPPGHGYPPGSFAPGMAPPNGLPLPPGAPQANTTYQSPYTPAPSAPSQTQGPQQPAHHMMRPPFYPAHPGHNHQAGSPGQIQGPHPPPGPPQYHQFQQRPPSTMIPFDQTPAVVEQMTNFKEILLKTLTLPDAERLIDRVISQATGKMPPTKEVMDSTTADAGIYKAVCDMLKPLRAKFDQENTASHYRPAPIQQDLKNIPITATSNTGTLASRNEPSPQEPQQQEASPARPIPQGIEAPDQPVAGGNGSSMTPLVGPESVQAPAETSEDSQPPDSRPGESGEKAGEVSASHTSADKTLANVKAPNNTGSMPLHNQERAQIFDLLQRLDPNAATEKPKDDPTVHAADTKAESPSAEIEEAEVSTQSHPTSATAVLHASEEAATMVMNAMGTAPKRQREDEQEDSLEPNEEPQAKRIAV